MSNPLGWPLGRTWSARRSIDGAAAPCSARRRGGWAAALAVVAGGVLASPAAAQDDQRRLERALRSGDVNDYRLRVDTNLQPLERTQLDVGGYTAMTALFLEDSDDNSRTLLQPELSLYARASIDGVHTFFGRARFAYREFSEGDSFDGRGDRWTEPFFDRYWYEFDLRRALEAYQGQSPEMNLNLRVGRQFVDWGAGLTLSEALYAVRPTLEFTRNFRLEALAGITPDHTVDFDASRENYDDRTRRGYFGLKLGFTTQDAREFYVFGLRMEDYGNDTQSRSPVLTGVNFEYEAMYVGLGTSGSIGPSLLYLGEIVYQAGHSQSDPLRSAQAQEQIGAYAARAQLTYLFRDPNQSRLQAELLLASGDDDRLVTSDTVGGNLAGTRDTAFNSLGFVNTGLAFAPSFSNLWAMRLGGSTYPLASVRWLDQLQVGVDGFWFQKFSSNAPIDEPTKEDRSLGAELDVYINYRLTSDLALNLRYGIFFPGEAILGSQSARNFFLVGVTLSF